MNAWTKENAREMFSAVSPRYDRLNRILSLAMDRGWRRLMVDWAGVERGARVLDVCTGTADICIEFASRALTGAITGVDFSRAMLDRAKEKLRRYGLESRVRLVEADVMALPFKKEGFDIVSAAFGLRNLVDYARGLAAMRGMLRDGGRLVVLEAIPPGRSLFGAVYRFYLSRFLPLAARLLGDRCGGFRYFSSSVRAFAGPAEICGWLRSSGFAGVRYKELAAGTACLFYGEKPSADVPAERARELNQK